MLVSSVIIVLREVLEAALLISVLLAVSRRLELKNRWLVAALVLGLAGAFTYARFLTQVTELFDGVGQELLNATLQYGIFAALIVITFQIARYRRDGYRGGRLLPGAMAVAVALAAAQEGAEITIYVSGFIGFEEFVLSVGIGSIAGAGIGFSVGVLFYYVLLAQPARRSLAISLALLALAAANMSAQATGLLIQADWLQAERPLWDTSGWIPEGSLPGELLYALVGYEATPSAAEVTMYLVALATIGVAALLGWRLVPADEAETL